MPRKTVRTHITSPEKMALINPNNLQLKDDFLLYLQSVQRSPGTIAGYESDLNIAFTYILDNLGNKDFQKISKRDLIRLQNWLVSEGLSSARIRRLKSAISSLSNYCENILSDDDPEFEGYRSIIRKIESPALRPVREKTVWEEDELQVLLDKLTNSKEYKKACYVALAMYGGRRKSELARFKVSDFVPEKLVCGGALYKSDPILTKGNKMLNCYTLSKKFQPYLDNWMNERAEKGIESPWLFPSSVDPQEQVSVSVLDNWADQFSRMTGKDFYPHSLRHFYVTSLSKAGIPASVIKTIVGWASVELVSVYDDTTSDEMLDKYFGEEGIKQVESKSLSDL